MSVIVEVVSSPDIEVTVTGPAAIAVAVHRGLPGVGVPAGGTTGQVLKKSSNSDYATEWANESGGGGLSDGDKGEITVSGSGATWTIDAGVVSTSKLGGDITAAGKALLDDVDASAQRTTLGLGTAATQASSAFAAASHSHAQSDITGLTSALAAKADLVGGVLATAQIPAIAVTEFLGSVANQAAMLALIGQKGDWAIRSDTGSTWVITGTDPSQLADWTELEYPAAPVTSINGQTGSVTLSATDVGAQASDPTLTALAGLTISTGTVIIGTGVDSFSVLQLTGNTFLAKVGLNAPSAEPITTFGLSLVDDANAATARTTLGATTVGGNLFTLANPSAISFARINADNTVTARSASELLADLGQEAPQVATLGSDTTFNDSAYTTILSVNVPNGQTFDFQFFAQVTLGTTSANLIQFRIQAAGTTIAAGTKRVVNTNAQWEPLHLARPYTNATGSTQTVTFQMKCKVSGVTYTAKTLNEDGEGPATFVIYRRVA